MRTYELSVVNAFRDQYTQEKYKPGKELNVSEERAFELLSSPYHLVQYISHEGDEGLEDIKAENDALKAENDALKAENDALKAENDALKAENIILKDNVDNLTSQNATLTTANDNLKSEINKSNKSTEIKEQKDKNK